MNFIIIIVIVIIFDMDMYSNQFKYFLKIKKNPLIKY